MKKNAKIKVLLVFANPLSTARLQLDMESREIQQAIERSKYRDIIEVIPRQAATIRDVRRALLEENFQIVHISGHGSRTGLILANNEGGWFTVDPQAFADLFQKRPSVECVILNSCYSLTQGRLLSAFVPFTVAIDEALHDQVAIGFATGFYDALGAGYPIDEAFEEGCLCAKLEVSSTAKLPRLLRKGEKFSPEDSAEEKELALVPEQPYIRSGRALVGFAFDLSGSMKQSIRNEAGDQHIDRLRGIELSIRDLIKDARESMKESQKRSIQNSLDVFLYGFGLRIFPICDLLSLNKAVREVFSRQSIDQYIEHYQEEHKEVFEEIEEAGKLASSMGLGGLASMGQTWFKKRAGNTLWQKILSEKKPILEKRLQEIGDTTLSVEELGHLWDNTEGMLEQTERWIFGDTPVQDALVAVTERFQRERQRRDDTASLVLFLISDGKFDHVDPLPIVRKLQTMGVTIISCLISDQDTVNQRALFNAPDPQWSSDAKLMFEISSPMEEMPEMRRYLLQHGWVIYPRPRLFVQLNNSDHLRVFVRAALSLLEDSEAAHQLPQGW